MTVSLCVIAFNEESAIGNLLNDILKQSYPKKLTEIVLVDSDSTDSTKKILLDFAARHKNKYWDILVLDNRRRSQAAGWNTAVSAAHGDVIIRIDAHANIPPEFTERNMNLISEGEFVCGGARPNNIDEPTPYREMLLLAESSMFGSSFASYRRQGSGKEYVDSLFHAAYSREVFAKVGGFNEDLGRTEDNELHYRIRKNGFKICQSSDIISYQNIRPTFKKMAAQKFANGKWIGLTSGVCPQCLSVFHFAPFCLVIAVIAGLLLLIAGHPLPLLILAALYAAGDIVMTVAAIVSAEHKSLWQLLLPAVFPALHFSYGIGTLIGIVLLPLWKSGLDGSANARIEYVKNKVIKNSHGGKANDFSADKDS